MFGADRATAIRMFEKLGMDFNRLVGAETYADEETSAGDPMEWIECEDRRDP